MPGLAGIGKSGGWIVDLDEPCEGEDCDYGAQLSRYPIFLQLSLESFDELRPLAQALKPGADVEFSLKIQVGKLHVVIIEHELRLRMLVPCRAGSTQIFEAQFDVAEALHLAAAIEAAVADAEAEG